jgi:hypothetical protein
LDDDDILALKGLLMVVDRGTIEVENATEETVESVKTKDRKKMERSIGILESKLEQLKNNCEQFKKAIKGML